MAWCFQMRMQLPPGQLDFVEKWPLMNPNELAFILIAYLIFVLKVGPVLMEKRPPFQIRGFLVFYNIFKVINCALLTSKTFGYIVERGLFPKICDHDEVTLHTIAATYWKFFVTKLIDLFDTIFFVLRKKNSQASFLHVYHHTFMVICTWTTLKYDPSDHWAFMAVFNCSIHTLMYVYYGFAAMGPSFAKYLWWKKYLTMMQLAQFVLVSAHIVVQTYTTQCPIHAVTYWVCLANSFLFLMLFADFYDRRYRKASHHKSDIDLVCTRQNFG